MNLDVPIQSLPLVGPSYVKRLKAVGVVTVRNLLFHFPHRYENFSLNTNISSVQSGEKVTVRGQILEINNIFTRHGKRIQKAVVSDGGGTIEITWFNQIYLPKSLPVGTWVSLSGKIEVFGRRRIMTSPQYEKLASGTWSLATETIHTGRLVPIYPETYGLSSKWIRGKIANLLPHALDSVEDYLPASLRTKYKLLNLKEAIKTVHFPESYEDAEKARYRLAFDEFLKIQLNTLLRKQNWLKKLKSNALIVDQDKVFQFINSLPFPLTAAQTRTIREILTDLQKEQAMNRLLEGDVGSGKTVVAAIACLVAVQNGFSAIIMAPTQILATQHFNTLKSVLEPQGISVALITSETKKLKNERTKEQVLVGTHALLHRKLPDNLGLVVIDEQHRFGVAQRALLSGAKKTHHPHVLTMTATPIPRTVALTIYGDLDLSILDEMPKGRIQIKTWVVPPQKRESAYQWIKERVKETDEQAFIVCPIIEESQKETMKSVKAATAEFERLSKEVFPDLRLALLHGRIKGKDKDKTMGSFREGKTDILIATPVVEVGIDIPLATIMMIEAAERFGLAQLHQLRGRVGRGAKQSYCLLMTESRAPRVLERLKALERNYSGAKLAEIDLEMRGPGEIYGYSQSGFPELKIGNFGDLGLIKIAREASEELITSKSPVVKNLLDETQTVVPN